MVLGPPELGGAGKDTMTTTTLDDLAEEHAYQWSGQRWTHHEANIHDAINALTRQAERLAPRVAREALDTACTNTKPTGPRSAIAYDLVAYGFCLNHISDDPTAVAAAGFTVETGTACICFAMGATGINQRHTLCPAHDTEAVAK